ncbi:hypothetical protein ACLKA7_005244 [Drosophila subpalustris]
MPDVEMPEELDIDREDLSLSNEIVESDEDNREAIMRVPPAQHRPSLQASRQQAQRNTVGPSRPLRPALAADRRQGQQRPPPKKAPLPGRGEPGGVDDPHRRTLCGSRTKWYIRYLQQGMSQEDALAKAKEPRPTTSGDRTPAKRSSSALTPPTDTPKRSRAQGSKGRKAGGSGRSPQHVKSSSSTEPRTSYAAVASKVKVAVLPVDYPQVILSHGELSALEEAILDQVILTGMEDDIPSPHTITLYLPRSADRESGDLLVMLSNQNKIESDAWRVISRKEEGGGALLVLGIDEMAKNNIVARGHQLFFRFGKIPVSGLKRVAERDGMRAAPAPLEATALASEDPPPTGTNMETSPAASGSSRSFRFIGGSSRGRRSGGSNTGSSRGRGDRRADGYVIPGTERRTGRSRRHSDAMR